MPKMLAVSESGQSWVNALEFCGDKFGRADGKRID
jgi:hypothetical protein